MAITAVDSTNLVTGNDPNILWEGTTWPMCCLSPLCCSVTKYTVTSQRIDKSAQPTLARAPGGLRLFDEHPTPLAESGCCGTNEDTLDRRRITDISYSACIPCCCCRGTVTIMASDETDPTTKITTWFTNELFHKCARPTSPLQSGTHACVVSQAQGRVVGCQGKRGGGCALALPWPSRT